MAAVTICSDVGAHLFVFISMTLGGGSEKATATHSSTLAFHALEKEMATYSSVLAWRIPGTREPGGLPSMGSHRVRHD